ncbi:MAG TPA: zf-HC2 domain-containing protein, partial [Longimicrobium sp.]|nr:zf-HC2 domain-containing protein [Longimicrobium sp.]
MPGITPGTSKSQLHRARMLLREGAGAMSHLSTDELNGFLDGELASAGAARARAHLDGCPACRAEAEGLRGVIARVRALPRSVAPPRDLRPRRRVAPARPLSLRRA